MVNLLATDTSRLPTDIWIDIFRSCTDTGYAKPSPYTAPLLLCRVSKSWRNLALSLPHLWNSLDVVVYLGRCYPHTELVLEFLRRSDALPLSIRLRQGDYSPASQAHTETLLYHIASRASQLKHLELTLAHIDLGLKDLLNDMRSYPCLPYLETFDFFYPSRLGRLNMTCLVEALGRAPLLRTVKLKCSAWGSPFTRYGISAISNLHQLTCAGLNNVPDVEAAMSLFASWPSLDRFELGIVGDTQYSSTPTVTMVHMTLRSLDLCVHSNCNFLPEFFRHLSLPSLQDLHIAIGYSSVVRTGLPDFLTRSACTLKSLKLINVNIDGTELRRILHHTSLQTLRFFSLVDERPVWTVVRVGPPEALHALKPLGDSAYSLLPELEALELIGDAFVVDNGKIVLDIVRSRRPRCCQSDPSPSSRGINSVPAGGRKSLRRFKCTRLSSIVDLRRLEQLSFGGLQLEYV